MSLCKYIGKAMLSQYQHRSIWLKIIVIFDIVSQSNIHEQLFRRLENSKYISYILRLGHFKAMVPSLHCLSLCVRPVVNW